VSLADGTSIRKQSRLGRSVATSEKLVGLLRAGDPNGDVATVSEAKEAVRELYAHADPDLSIEWVT
jgi:hypothetical protein